jgi:4-carboxymuconolactone decarboxylase
MAAEDPLLPGLTDLDALAAAWQAGVPEAFASSPLFRVALHHPPIARIISEIQESIVRRSRLHPRLREIAIMRTAWHQKSVYVWTNHYRQAREAGLSDDEVILVRAGPVETWDEPARLVLRLVDEVVEVAVSPNTVRSVRRALDDDVALLELIAIPGLFSTVASVVASFGVQLVADSPSWPPDGVTPVSY